MSYINNINTINGFTSISGFGNTFLCTNAINEDKTVDFPDGYNQDLNISFKVIFQNGHQKTTSENMTLNGIAVVANKFGTLIPIPNHEITTGNFSTLQANTVLEMYYTNNYDGNNNPAFVIIGNPVVLSSVDYTIYADGKVGDEIIGTIKPYYKNSRPYGWLICDGGNGLGSSTGSETFNTTEYPDLYTFLGTNKVPDLRECALVGIGTNRTFTIASHDTYIVGEFKDDCFQGHEHSLGTGLVNKIATTQGMDIGTHNTQMYGDPLYDTSGIAWKSGYASPRVQQTTHGKQIGIQYLIKGL